MKLKYYLRGLGIGMILTTLILTLSHKKMTDQEIIHEAMKLGMVKKEDTKGNLDEVYAKHNSKDSDKQEAVTTPAEEVDKDITNNDEVTDDSVTTDGADNSVTDDGANNSVSADGADDSVTDDGANNSVSTDGADDSVTTNGTDNSVTAGGADEAVLPDGASITFTIEKGMSSNKVSIMLEALGLIQNAREFNNYVLQEGKTETIKIGTYTLPASVDYQQILDAIAPQ